MSPETLALPAPPFDPFFQHARLITGVILIGVFFGALLHNWWTGRTTGLDHLLSRALTSTGLYVGFLLLLCGFDNSYLTRMQEIDAYLWIAGLALIYVAVTNGILPPKKEPPPKTPHVPPPDPY